MNSDTTTGAPIMSFTLEELIRLSGRERHGLKRECVITQTYSKMQTFRTPIRIDATILGVCLEGEATVAVNLRDFRLQAGSLFVFAPQSMIQMISNENFKAHFILISTELLDHINLDLKQTMPFILQLDSHPCIEITEAQGRSLRTLISTVEQEMDNTEGRFSREIICQLVGALLYKVGNILSGYQASHPELSAPLHNRAEEYFRHFMQLLGEHYKEERSVGFYARQLCVTPKYLTTLIKRLSHRSVSEWIDKYVVMEAKMLLKYSNMSIQEIAYSLHFPNQSFFGSYFKRNTGMSPSQYKTSELTAEGNTLQNE